MILRKICLSFIIMLFSSATVADVIDSTFQERLLERYGHLNDQIVVSQIEGGEELSTLQESEFDTLIDFANRFDLQSLGFSYEMNKNVYEIKIDGEAKYYIFAIEILKNHKEMTRRFYEVSIRVDGVPYVSRIVNYDY